MKPLAPHGTIARAHGRPEQGVAPCACRPCRDATNRYAKRLRVDRELGRARRVDAAPIAERLRLLRAAGCSWRYLATTTGCSESQLSAISRDRHRTVLAATAAAVLAVRPTPTPTGRVPAIGAARRLRALLAIGHTVAAIVDATGLDQTTISPLASGRQASVRPETAARIVAAYGRLSASVGPSDLNRARAARQGWAPPHAWVDEPIDDPDAKPYPWRAEPGDRRGLRSVILVEEARFLVEDAGLNRSAAARQLGMSREGLDRALQRAGHADLGRAA